MSDIPNLWGNLEIEEYTKNPLKNPSTILKEQATLIGKMTKGLILGEVDSINSKFFDNIQKIRAELGEKPPELLTYLKNQNDSHHPLFGQILRLTVPSLNNYTYSLLQVIYPIESYPAVVSSLVSEEKKIICNNEEEFLAALEEILSSDKVHRVIQVLLSQMA